MDFEIIHEHNASYTVKVVNSETGERGKTIISLIKTSVNISQLLDPCRGQRLTVQTIVDDQYFSQPESFVHYPNSKPVA